MVKESPAAIQTWSIDKLILYARNPRKNDAAVDRMCGSIREFGFKIPVLARSDGEVVDGHLRLNAARKLGITEVPVILCDEWTPAQVKAFRLMVNRSVTWADWDEELLGLELQELNATDYDLEFTGFNPKEIDDLLALPEKEKVNESPPLPENPVSRAGDLWICGKHRVLCGSSTSTEDVAQLLRDRKPLLMVTDPPYGIQLDSEWRDRAGLNGYRAAEPSYMKKRIIWDKGRTVLTRRIEAVSSAAASSVPMVYSPAIRLGWAVGQTGPASPIATISASAWVSGSASSLAATSGPMPEGSPAKRPIRGFIASTIVAASFNDALSPWGFRRRENRSGHQKRVRPVLYQFSSKYQLKMLLVGSCPRIPAHRCRKEWLWLPIMNNNVSVGWHCPLCDTLASVKSYFSEAK